MRVVLRIVVGAGFFIVFALALGGYRYDWTGFGSRPIDDHVTPAKTLWDWLGLLIVPTVLAVGAFLLDGSRKRSEQAIEQDRQRQEVLERFFEYVSALILEGHLFDGAQQGRARELVRTRALTALRLLDGRRKAQLLQFLYEAELISIDPIVQLNGADFTNASLDEATLRGAELRGVYFGGCSIRGANLRGADMRGSDFENVDFAGTDLSETRLRQANFRGADLRETTLTRTDLTTSELQGARLRRQQRDAISCQEGE